MLFSFHALRLHLARIGGVLWMAGDIMTAFKQYFEQKLYTIAQATILDTTAGILFIVSSFVLIGRGHRHNGVILGRSFSFAGLACLIVSAAEQSALLSMLSLLGMEISCIMSIIEAFRDKTKQQKKMRNILFPQLIPMLPSLVCNIGYLVGAFLKYSLPEVGVGLLWMGGTLCLALSRQEIKSVS